MRRAVVKLGGSTANEAVLGQWIAALAGSGLPLVIVPGGGRFADQVRDAQKGMGFSDKAAHAMAILAMDQFGHVILDRDDRLVPARSLPDMERALGGGEIPVWLPSSLAIPAPDVRASWDITSDALAAWLAGKLGADALLLVKQTDAFSSADDVASLTARGVIDAGFGAMLPADGAFHLAGPRDVATAAAMLSSGRLPGTHIASRTTPTPNPSPQGGGGLCADAVLRQPSTVLAERTATRSPSPLRGGVRGGGTRPGNSRT